MACEERIFPTGMEGKVVTVEFVNNDCKKFQYEDGDLVSDLYFPNEVRGFIQNIGEDGIVRQDGRGRQFMQNHAYSCELFEFPKHKQGVVRFADAKDPRYRDRFDHDRFNADREISDFFMFWPGYMELFQQWVTLHPEEMMDIVRANVARLISGQTDFQFESLAEKTTNAYFEVCVDKVLDVVINKVADDYTSTGSAVFDREFLAQKTVNAFLDINVNQFLGDVVDEVVDDYSRTVIKKRKLELAEQNDINEADRFAKKAKAVADKASEFAGVTKRICKEAGDLADEAVNIVHDAGNISTVHSQSLFESARGIARVMTQFWDDMEGIADEAKSNADEAKRNADKAYDDLEERILLSAD
jgi:hypothetical protein